MPRIPREEIEEKNRTPVLHYNASGFNERESTYLLAGWAPREKPWVPGSRAKHMKAGELQRHGPKNVQSNLPDYIVRDVCFAH